ncbi:MAG: oxidoreductase [candidate division WOR-3 bacterium]
MAEKPWVAFYWCGSCGGCEEAVVDLAEKILDVVNAVNIGFWPVALDFKKSDVEEKPDGFFAVSFINGTIESDEHREMVELLRRKSGLVVAFGSCSHMGGIPSLRNLYDVNDCVDYAYRKTVSTVNPEGTIPLPRYKHPSGHETTTMNLEPTGKALDQVIDVDYYLPGCSVPKHLILDAVMAILSGNLPPKGSVLSPSKALCSVCPRQETKPEKMQIKDIKRHHLSEDDGTCFNAQGMICMGPATRSGCGDPAKDNAPRCILVNMPCHGCFGPPDGTLDQGMAMLSAIASGLDYTPDEEAEIDRIIKKIGDLAGTFYMFSTAKSLIHGRPAGEGVKKPVEVPKEGGA